MVRLYMDTKTRLYAHPGRGYSIYYAGVHDAGRVFHHL